MTPRPRRITRLAAAAVLLGVFASACASASDGSSAPDVTPPATASSAEPSATSTGSPTTASNSDAEATTATAPVPVPEALQFSAPLVGGGEFTGADYAAKPTVFWFWAPT